jgi:hypothetical protein
MDVAALIISILALFFSFWSIVFGKNIEIKSKKFDELVLNELKVNFLILDELLESKPNEIFSSHLSTFTDVYVDIMVYMVASKNHFSGINIDNIQDELQEFSDGLYETPMIMLSERKSEYRIHKMKIMCLIYDQAINHVTWGWLSRK